MKDPRAAVARFYDLDREPLADLPFYVAHLPSASARVLELGCGTGRITLPLAMRCGFVHGIELSKAMLEICREKLLHMPELAGMFRCIRNHLAPGGSCILNVFNPRYSSAQALIEAWSQPVEFSS